MNSIRFNIEFSRQIISAVVAFCDLLKHQDIINRTTDLIECSGIIIADLGKESVFLHPISQGPCHMAERPMSLYSLPRSDLILIHHEEVLQLSVARFDTPSQSIEAHDLLCGKHRTVCEKNVDFLLILFAIWPKEDDEFKRYLAVFKPTNELIAFNRFGLAVVIHETHRLDFIQVMLPDEGNELALFHVPGLSLNGVIHENVTIGLGLADKRMIMRIDERDQLRRMGVPRIDNYRLEIYLFVDGVQNQLFSELYLAFKRVGIRFVSFILLSFFVKTIIDGEVFVFRDKRRRNKHVAHGFMAKGSAVLIICSFRLLGVNLWAGRVVNSQNAILCRSCSPLAFDKRNPGVIDLVNIPLRVGEKVLEIFVVTEGFSCDGFKARAFHVPEQRADIYAEIDHLLSAEEALEPGQKPLDESAPDCKTIHILCFLVDSVFVIPTAYYTRSKGLFIGGDDPTRDAIDVSLGFLNL